MLMLEANSAINLTEKINGNFMHHLVTGNLSILIKNKHNAQSMSKVLRYWKELSVI
jgi:hypothetical protein